jgi:hypothetical protein
VSRQFFTERDIIDLARRGVRRLEIGLDDRLTDVARERAEKEGLVVERRERPRPVEVQFAPPAGPAGREALHARVRASVLAKLGAEIDGQLLDRIIQRVLDHIGPA